MKLSECNIGTIVTTTYGEHRKDGHIRGLDINDIGQVVVLVQWADGQLKGYRPYNLITLKELENGV